jgi:hypothetical protein
VFWDERSVPVSRLCFSRSARSPHRTTRPGLHLSHVARRASPRAALVGPSVEQQAVFAGGRCWSVSLRRPAIRVLHQGARSEGGRALGAALYEKSFVPPFQAREGHVASLCGRPGGGPSEFALHGAFSGPGRPLGVAMGGAGTPDEKGWRRLSVVCSYQCLPASNRCGVVKWIPPGPLTPQARKVPAHAPDVSCPYGRLHGRASSRRLRPRPRATGVHFGTQGFGLVRTAVRLSPVPLFPQPPCLHVRLWHPRHPRLC